MSRSPPHQSPLGQAEASSSRASNGKQPAVEDDYSDEEALLADDPLERDLPEQYAPSNLNIGRKAYLSL
jgi:chloride channel 3/4/5